VCEKVNCHCTGTTKVVITLSNASD